MNEYAFKLLVKVKEDEEGIARMEVVVQAKNFEQAYSNVKSYFSVNDNPRIEIESGEKIWRAVGYPRNRRNEF